MIAICSLVKFANNKVPLQGGEPVPQTLGLLGGEQLYDFRRLKCLPQKSGCKT